MGDLHSWPAHSNGNLSDPAPTSLLQPYPPNPDPSTIDAATWQRADEAAQEVLQHVHPTPSSERRRSEVVQYVQRIIRQFTGAEICPFGSVPLKTYLPDGDIDLTAMAFGPNFEDNLPTDVKNVLDMEEKRNNGSNSDSKFEVKDVQLILAEVKLVKCLVQNIIVDISFNQIGGLYTLCFLEQVDQLIGKDHLFKRSIMLIKSWCYYESRILGAHHGLISTYALETLVLYIFHLFHKSLDSPLAVLYRFLDYFSKFKWETYGVSLNGPIPLSSLPNINAEALEIETSDLLIQKEFVDQILKQFQVPPRPNEVRVFTRKNLNIVDPLKISNNLGRSVSKGNFFRIKSAFVFGARKLGQILTSSDTISADVSMFFRNTLERHGSGNRPDIPDPSRSPSSSSSSIYHAPHMFFTAHTNNNNDDNDNININNNNNNDDDDNNNNNNCNDGFADLSGDMIGNTNCLLYAKQFFMEANMVQPVNPMPMYARPGMGYRGMQPVGPGYGFRRGAPLYFSPGPPGSYYVMPLGAPPPPPPGAAGLAAESPKPRGTGTYFPQHTYRPQNNYRERDNNRNNSPRGKRNTGRATESGPSSEESVPGSDMHQQGPPPMPPPPPAVQLIPLHVGPPPQRWVPTGGVANGGGTGGVPVSRQVEFGSLGSVVLNQGGRPVSDQSNGAGGNSSIRHGLGSNQRKRSSQQYQLKDDGDFPPLG